MKESFFILLLGVLFGACEKEQLIDCSEFSPNRDVSILLSARDGNPIFSLEASYRFERGESPCTPELTVDFYVYRECGLGDTVQLTSNVPFSLLENVRNNELWIGEVVDDGKGFSFQACYEFGGARQCGSIWSTHECGAENRLNTLQRTLDSLLGRMDRQKEQVKS